MFGHSRDYFAWFGVLNVRYMGSHTAGQRIASLAYVWFLAFRANDAIYDEGAFAIKVVSYCMVIAIDGALDSFTYDHPGTIDAIFPTFIVPIFQGLIGIYVCMDQNILEIFWSSKGYDGFIFCQH